MLKTTASLYHKILHIRLTDTFASLPKHALELVSPNNPVKRLLKIVLYTGGRLVFNLFKVNKRIDHLQGKIWLYVVSQNNVDALQFIKEAMPEAAFVAGQNKNIGRYGNSVNRIPYRFKILYYYKYPLVLWQLYKTHGRKALRFFDLIYDSIGYYELYLQVLRKNKPAAIIFSNDHNPDARAMLYAAKSHGIPTVYIQHASVSDSFPPLEHDLNLLEGQAALDTYKKCGLVAGEVKFIGMPKADAFVRNRKNSGPIKRIGLCCNTIDSLAGIEETLKVLTAQFPNITVTVRPHPRDTRDFGFIKKINPNTLLSDAANQVAFEFLTEQDLVVAGDSSILLEAVLLNVPGIYYKFDREVKLNDYYGYVQHGVVEQATDAQQLAQLIQQYSTHPTDVYQRAGYYNATVGTEYDGRSHELAIDYLRTFLNSN